LVKENGSISGFLKIDFGGVEEVLGVELFDYSGDYFSLY